MSYSYWISQCLVQWLTCRSLWLFCCMDAFEFPASSWSWGERRGWRQMLRGNQKSLSRWRGGRGGNLGIVSSSSLTSLHYLLSLLVKNSMPAFERDIHCLFGLFNFAWLKHFGSFPHLMRDQIASILLTPKRLQRRRVYGVKREKCPKLQFCYTSQSLQMPEWSRSRSELWS